MSTTMTSTATTTETIAPSAGIEVYDYHTKEQGDIFRDTQLRYLAFAQRILRVVSNAFTDHHIAYCYVWVDYTVG